MGLGHHTGLEAGWHHTALACMAEITSPPLPLPQKRCLHQTAFWERCMANPSSRNMPTRSALALNYVGATCQWGDSDLSPLQFTVADAVTGTGRYGSLNWYIWDSDQMCTKGMTQSYNRRGWIITATSRKGRFDPTNERGNPVFILLIFPAGTVTKILAMTPWWHTVQVLCQRMPRLPKKCSFSGISFRWRHYKWT